MHMKKPHRLLFALAIGTLAACNTSTQSPVSLQWEMGENQVEPDYYESTFTLVNTSKKPLESGWEIYFTQLSPRGIKAFEESPVTIKMVNPGYYKIAPADSWQPLAPGDSIAIPYLTGGTFIQTQFTPKSPFFVSADDKAVSIPFTIAPFTRESQWTIPGHKAPNYPDGEVCYAQNEALQTDSSCKPTTCCLRSKR